MKYKQLPYGARFKYQDCDRIWIKMFDNRMDGLGLVAQYNEIAFTHGNWIGQVVCSFADTRDEYENLEVELVG